ncbi:MAG: type II toxin-antitoxin system PemK/MazF family toxin [Candidatus Paracaedibacteraceae bacterium]|nr:type II toxin-antitoxin system PemK/MazF family toxin [Candidatus Paracaedibacteraceae bacterium]
MGIREHPKKGTVIMCDFDSGFKQPEMVKRRPVIVISPQIKTRAGLCTVVALSTTKPDPIMPYHSEIILPPNKFPEKINNTVWVKGDMINTVGFHRLDLIRLGKDYTGKRTYCYHVLDDKTMRIVQKCVLNGLGLSGLTKHLNDTMF